MRIISARADMQI